MQDWPQMRTLFPGNYRLLESEIDNIWSEAIFVLDANVLLNIYRYSPNAQDGFQKVLDAIKTRLWIPYQAAAEFQRNRLKVIVNQIAAYESAIADSERLLNSLTASRSHPFVADETLHRTRAALEDLTAQLRNRLDAHEKLLHTDPHLDAITQQISGCIGSEPSKEQQREQNELARSRIEQKIPPGYKDKKSDDRDIGDALIWLQTLAHAKEAKRPMVLVTDDAKEDWWEVLRGRTIGPRPELVRDFVREVGQLFHMYQPSQFIKYAINRFKLDVDVSIIAEAKSVTSDRVSAPSNAATVSDSEKITPRLIREYIHSRFPGRRRSTLRDATEIAKELRAAGLRTMADVEQLVSDNWAEFELYEGERIASGSGGRFAEVGVLRIILHHLPT